MNLQNIKSQQHVEGSLVTFVKINMHTMGSNNLLSTDTTNQADRLHKDKLLIFFANKTEIEKQFVQLLKQQLTCN